MHTFKAVLKDKFNPNAAPCDMELNISVGARVMMLVNDHNIGYCNGSLGYVTDITQKEDGTPIVTVSLDNGIQTSVEPYKWEANEYKVEDKRLSRLQLEVVLNSHSPWHGPLRSINPRGLRLIKSSCIPNALSAPVKSMWLSADAPLSKASRLIHSLPPNTYLLMMNW